jgi:hypothetical protein
MNQIEYNGVIILSYPSSENSKSEFTAEAQDDESGRNFYTSDDYPTEAEAIQDVKDWLETPKTYQFQKSIKWVNFNLEIEAKSPAEAVKIMEESKFTDWQCIADNEENGSLEDLFNLRVANRFLKGEDENGNVIF